MALLSSPELIGREVETVALTRSLRAAGEGEPSLTVLAGEAGIGKTRVVRRTEEIAREWGLLTLSGDCLQLSGGEFPYAPIAAALRGADGELLAAVLASLPRLARADLARVFPDVVTAAEDAGQSPGEAGQARLFTWLVSVLRGLSQAFPLLLVIEDMHWADLSTRDFLLFLVRNIRVERLAVIATVRADELHREHPTRGLLAELSRSQRVRRLDLSPLTRPEIERQIAEILRSPPPARLVEQLYARAQGNPFYTEELLAAGATTRAERPETLRDALLLRLEALYDSSREVLQLVAAAGRGVDDAMIRTATQLPDLELRAALRQCVDQNVLICDRGTGHYEIRHALGREAIYGDLLPTERALLHRRIAQTLELRRPAASAAERAHHWQQAGEPSHALRASIEAGLADESIFAHAEALAHFDRAIELWASEPPDAAEPVLDLVALFTHAAEAARLSGLPDRALSLCRHALDAFDHSTDPLRAAGLLERLGRYQPWNVEESLSAYERAIELLPLDCVVERMRLKVNEALAHTFSSRWDEASRRAEAALAMAQGPDTRAQEGAARAVLGVATAFLGDPLVGERQLRRALELTAPTGSAQEVMQVHLDLGEVLRLQGRTEEALDVMLDGERLVAQLGGERSYGAFIAINAADDLLRLGRWDEVEQRLEALAGRQIGRTGDLFVASVAGRLAVARGDETAAMTQLDRGVELCCRDGLAEFVPAVYAGYAELELWRGRPAAACDRVTEGLAVIGSPDNLLHVPLLRAAGVRAQAELSELSRARGDRISAEDARRRAAEHHECLRASLTGRGGHAPAEALAHLASAAAELSRAEGATSPGQWAESVAAWRSAGFPYQLAYASYRHAEALLFAGARRAEAKLALTTAGVAAARLRAAPLFDAIHSLARRARLDLSATPAPASTTSGSSRQPRMSERGSG